MLKLRRILVVYLLFGALVFTAWLIAVGTGTAAESRRLAARNGDLEQLRVQYDEAHDEALQLREKQRQERDNYSGQQAIEASAAAQAAIEHEQTLLGKIEETENSLAADREALGKKQRSLVPIIALCLIHWLLLPLVTAKRS
jgi:hypothetical protein